MNAIPALDGLRALAVLLVILFHAWTFVPGYIQPGQNAADYALFYGKTGVQLFFVLSGFLLFLPYAQWIFGLRERPSTLMFYKRRALRVGGRGGAFRRGRLYSGRLFARIWVSGYCGGAFGPAEPDGDCAFRALLRRSSGRKREYGAQRGDRS